ncbi:uncharacterized protein LOC135833755 [Planococcus citri]|uniref:uncharacterized protein LOC135833755 n=1 Tax=Planococcus citri TaxID=170843 RepID=UPI0031F964B5
MICIFRFELKLAIENCTTDLVKQRYHRYDHHATFLLKFSTRNKCSRCCIRRDGCMIRSFDSKAFAGISICLMFYFIVEMCIFWKKEKLNIFTSCYRIGGEDRPCQSKNGTQMQILPIRVISSAQLQNTSILRLRTCNVLLRM